MKIFNNQFGFSLVEISLTVGMLAILSFGIVKLTSIGTAVVDSTARAGNLKEVLSQIQSALENAESFKETLNHSSNKDAFDCIVNGPKDCNGAGKDFMIFESQAGVVKRLESVAVVSEPNVGINSVGNMANVKCDNFDDLNGSDTCPFRIVATWKPYCPPAQNIQNKASVETNCLNPMLDINVTLKFRPKTMSLFDSINPEKYSIHLLKAQSETSLQQACGLIPGATISLATNSCITKNMLRGTDCKTLMPCPVSPTGKTPVAIMAGIRGDGTPICKCNIVGTGALGKSCNNAGTFIDGNVLLGFNADGSLKCGPGMLAIMRQTGAIRNPTINFGNNGY